MIELISIVFILGYLFIALEHVVNINKAASALVSGVLCWAIFVLFSHSQTEFVYSELQHHLIHISEILFFLLGAMTIVELIDTHDGFRVITDKINTISRVKLLWITSILAFFASAILDNLTTAIVMAALLPKLMKDKSDIWFFGGMIILACNAGGAWSPIGDITTIMLWIGGQVSLDIIPSIFIPSVVCMVSPLIYLSFKIKGNVTPPNKVEKSKKTDKIVSIYERNFIFISGVFSLLFVPVFKTITHLPPYMGMLLSLGVLWIATELLHKSKNYEHKSLLSVVSVLKKIDTPTIYFFLGILLAVSCLQSIGLLNDLADYLNNTIGNIYVINLVIGLCSAIVDNVPLVAGAMGMYPIDEIGPFSKDGVFWEFLAYCAGTGGSVLIIGSAAGVAVMGILKIDFIWYLKKISYLAFIGYVYGALAYILLALI